MYTYISYQLYYIKYNDILISNYNNIILNNIYIIWKIKCYKLILKITIITCSIINYNL